MFDGKRMNDYETPKSLELEQDDVIEVYQEQTGGGSWEEMLDSRNSPKSSTDDIIEVYQEKSGGMADEGETDYIKLKVIDQDSNEIHFRVKMTTQMGKLKKSYSERVGTPIESLRFLFDGKPINDNATPNSLEIDQNMEIDVYKKQFGGSTIDLKFVGVDKKERSISIIKTLTFSEIKVMYTNDFEKTDSPVKFILKDRVIEEDETPEILDLQVNDLITVVLDTKHKKNLEKNNNYNPQEMLTTLTNKKKGLSMINRHIFLQSIIKKKIICMTIQTMTSQ